MTARRRSPPLRTFQVESIAHQPASEDGTTDVIDGDDVEYDPEIVAKVLKAAEGPFTAFSIVEDALRTHSGRSGHGRKAAEKNIC